MIGIALAAQAFATCSAPSALTACATAGFGFGLVDRRKAAALNDNIWTLACDRRGDGLRVGKIEFRAADRHHLNTDAPAVSARPRANWALAAGDENLHLASCFTAPGGRSRLAARPSRSPA